MGIPSRLWCSVCVTMILLSSYWMLNLIESSSCGPCSEHRSWNRKASKYSQLTVPITMSLMHESLLCGMECLIRSDPKVGGIPSRRLSVQVLLDYGVDVSTTYNDSLVRRQPWDSQASTIKYRLLRRCVSSKSRTSLDVQLLRIWPPPRCKKLRRNKS